MTNEATLSEELRGLAVNVREHATSDPDEQNLRDFMRWVAEQLERLANQAE